MNKIPTLIIVTGFPATGKTTLAKKLSEHFSLPLVCVDELKEMMFDRIGNWENEKLFDSVSKAAYDLMYHMTGLTLSVGQSCIIEGFFRAELASPRIAKLKEKYNCNIVQFQLNCNPHTMIERYDSRHNSSERHSCHPAISDEIRQKFIELGGKNPSPEVDGQTIVIDSTKFENIDWANIFQKVKEYVNLSGVEFLKSLAKKRVAAGILLYNKEGNVLILKPTYKDDWTIPGGAIEEGEFLLDGLRREMREEIGLEAEIKKLSVVDSKIIKKDGYIDDSLQIIFEGKILTEEQVAHIKPSADEISEFKFVDLEEALKLLNQNLSKRISHISKNENTILLNNGEIVLK